LAGRFSSNCGSTCLFKASKASGWRKNWVLDEKILVKSLNFSWVLSQVPEISFECFRVTQSLSPLDTALDSALAIQGEINASYLFEQFEKLAEVFGNFGRRLCLCRRLRTGDVGMMSLSPARTGSAVPARASKNARRSAERVTRTCKLNGRDKEHVFCEDLAILTVYGQTGLVIRATCLIYLGWFSGNTIFRGHRRRLPTSD
jgi:hypothetical protein